MTDQPWRHHLNEAERAEVAVLDKHIEYHRTHGAEFTAQREIIRRRAVQRMRKVLGINKERRREISAWHKAKREQAK